MLNIIKIEGLTIEKIQEAYNYLYDEYGYIINSWTDSKLEQEIKDFWKSKEKIKWIINKERNS